VLARGGLDEAPAVVVVHADARARVDDRLHRVAGPTHRRLAQPITHTNTHTHTHTHTRPFNGPFSGTTRVSRYQKGKTRLDFTEASDSEWQWHQLGRMQVCISLRTANHASTPPLKFFTGRMPFLPPSQQRQSTEGHLAQPINQLQLKVVQLQCFDDVGWAAGRASGV